LAGGRLARLDLRKIAPQVADFKRVTETYEKMVDEPHFHTRNVREIKVEVPPYKASDGKVYNFRVVKQAGFGLHAGPEDIGKLATLTQSQVPIIRYDEFIFRTLSTLNGGLYLEFADIPDSLDGFLKQAGGSLEQVLKQRSDARTATPRSKVSGKPREGMFFYGTNVNPKKGIPLITLTFDNFDEDNDPERNVFQNLLNFKSRAIEAIVVKPNGMLKYGLFNAENKKLQKSVPDNVAKDHEIPRVCGTARLEGAISCIRCHGPHDGFQPFPNVIQEMIAAGGEIFDDESSEFSPEETLDILAGRYAGDMEEPLRLVRNAHAFTTFSLTGMDVATVSAEIANVYEAYVYDTVTPHTACAELGYVLDDADSAVSVLRQILPPLPPNAFGKRTEDPLILVLKSGNGITRKDWNRIFADAMLRVKTNELSQRKGVPK
jgi:hypothetical protein